MLFEQYFLPQPTLIGMSVTSKDASILHVLESIAAFDDTCGNSKAVFAEVMPRAYRLQSVPVCKTEYCGSKLLRMALLVSYCSTRKLSQLLTGKGD